MFSFWNKSISFHHTVDAHPMRLMDIMELHAHENNEIFYFISGKAKYLVEGSVYKLYPGSILIMRSGEFHKIIIDDDQPYERMALNFKTDILDSVDPEHALLEPFVNRPLGVGNLISPNEIHIGHIYECLKSIDTATQDDNMRRIAIQCNLFPILFEIKMAFIARRSEIAQHTDVRTLSGEIIAYINANLSGELSLDILSDKFFISKNHLNRIFKSATGMTVWEYVKLKRLMMARSYMLEGTTAIEACNCSGFRDYSAFYRAYKEQFGCSPKMANKSK